MSSARDWLGDLLSEGQIAQRDAIKQAAAEGISEAALFAARGAMRLVCWNANKQNRRAQLEVWFWRLPDERKISAPFGRYRD